MHWCSVTTRTTVLVAIGLGFALTSVVCYVLMPYIIEYVVKQKLILSSDSMTFDGWRRPSVPIYTQIYIFNVTNTDDILSQDRNPILQELGPYTFKQSLEKVNISWNDSDGTVSYNQMKRWHFVPEMTNGSLDDKISHLNVPMISAANKISRSTDEFYYDALNVIIDESKSLIFKKNSVRELLFDGYDEILLKAAKELFPDTPFTRFGWYYSKNDTSSDGRFSIYTGKNDINRLGLLDSWNHLKTNDKWFGKECQRFDGISGGDFQPPYKKPKPSKVEIFIGDLCRSLSFSYAQEVYHKSIKTSRYWLSPSVFDYSLAENQCYCESSCPANGVLNVSVCTMGSPTVISFPHFLYADPTYLKSIDGLNPSPVRHTSYMDFENSLGIPLNVAIRLQINTVVDRISELDFAKNLTKSRVVFPQFWFSTTSQVGEEAMIQLDSLVNKVPLYVNITSFLLLLIGFLILISATIYCYRTKRTLHSNQRQKYKSVELISTTSDT